MTAGAGAALQMLHRAADLQRVSARRLAAYVSVRQVLSALLVIGAADILFPLSGGLRGFLLFWTLANGLLSYRRNRGDSPPDIAAAARRIEKEKPELDNALIHAAQFAPLLEAKPEPPAAVFMRRELERAAQQISGLSEKSLVPLDALRHARRQARFVLACAFVSMLLFPRAWRFEAPRLLAFWQDFPPFTRTDFTVLPGNTQVNRNQSLTITAKLDRPLPPALELVSAQGSEPPQTAPMMKINENTFAVSLAGISETTWYYAQGETGRSSRYILRVKPETEPKKNGTATADSAQKETHKTAEPQKNSHVSDADKQVRKLANAQAKLEQEAKQNAVNPSNPIGAKKNAELRRRQRDLQKQIAALAAKLKQTPEALQKAMRQMADEGTGAGKEAGSGAGENRAAGKSAGTVRAEHAKPTDERAIPFSSNHTGSPGTAPPAGALLTGKNGDVSRYPAEYRRLVQDYFKSVAGK